MDASVGLSQLKLRTASKKTHKFLNLKVSHGFSRLFIDSLQNIITSKTGLSPLIMKTFSVLLLLLL